MTQPTTLFHLSDLHFGVEDRDALAWAAAQIASEKPDGVVITGDLTMRSTHSQYQAAAEWIAALGVPVDVNVGNHDMPYYSPIERFKTPYRRYENLLTKVPQPIPTPPNFTIIRLNTTAPAQWRTNWSNGVVYPEELEKTLEAIEALPEGTHALISAHHPLIGNDHKGREYTRGGYAALCAFATRKVIGVLSGHVHNAFNEVEETPAGPIHMIGAGTLSTRLRKTPPSLNVLRITGGHVNVELRQLRAAL